jgi:hypothetical protein
MTQLNPRLQSAQQKRVATLLTIAQLGYAHWFFGNLYEAVVRVPDRLAKDYAPGVADRRLAFVRSAGSPVRYYRPGVPVVLGATPSALVAGWTSRHDRPWLGATAVSALLAELDGLRYPTCPTLLFRRALPTLPIRAGAWLGIMTRRRG